MNKSKIASWAIRCKDTARLIQTTKYENVANNVNKHSPKYEAVPFSVHLVTKNRPSKEVRF